MIDFLAKSSKNDLIYIKKTIENKINSTLLKKHFNNFTEKEIFLIETIFNYFENVIIVHNLKISDLVKKNFLKITKKESLLENIKDDTSGDYFQLLKSLIETN